MRSQFHRQTEIARIRAELELKGLPRLKMLLIITLTGGAGFLASFSMLRCCVTSMATRYPLSIAIAYVVFLFFLWLWLRTSAEDYTDFPDLSGIPTCRNVPADCSEVHSMASADGGSISDTIGAAASADEVAIPLLVLLVVGALLLSSLWIVYTAPTLFAELLVDGALSASLYRRLRGLDTQHWLATAISRTIWPFVIAAVIAGFGGKALQFYVPTAHSLGEVIHWHE
ncbi:hypothetical protein [Herbaspirillum sp. ST 5-3]|uniref:hypothetical protein n=1 Tax=Oxalobacteraceae TaxID=75682 RepID=UPI0010A33EFE|nr:hypothetical protein [Herbaspirillum sp. ST 5-3]